MKLFIRQSRGGDTNTASVLEMLNVERLPRRFGLGTGGEVFTDALAVQPTGNAENDFSGGIRER